MFEEISVSSCPKGKLFETVKAFHACKQEDGQSVSFYLLKMKSYLDTVECLGYALPKELGVSLILNSLNKDYDQFVQNYNMHSMGKTLVELHAMLKLHEKEGCLEFEESLGRDLDGTEGFLLPEFANFWLTKVSTVSAKFSTDKRKTTEGNSEFHDIINFLKRSSIHHALTVSPVVSTTFIEQFWTSAKSKTVDNVRYIKAKVAGVTPRQGENARHNMKDINIAHGIFIEEY
ncbi:hypothetical protein Tco_0560526 [Tanacetum coccineum]